METTTQNSIQLDPTNIPTHIAVILDGNGRWARKRGLPRLAGHTQGYKALRDFVTSCSDLGVKFVTAYAFSSENWKRPPDEVAGLMKLIAFAAKIELGMMMSRGVRIVTSGRFHELPKELQKQLREDTETTKNNTGIVLNLAINYGGRNEIVDAAREAARQVASGSIKPEDIDDVLISSLMYHPEIPDPDLIIRTAGEMRLSNFLTWETVYSEIFVTDLPWPDVNEEVLRGAIAWYQTRVRRFGAVVEK